MSASLTSNASAQKLDSSYLEGMFQGAGLAIVACDTAGLVVAWNPAAERLFGNGEARFLGRRVTTLLAEPQQRVAEEYLNQCLSMNMPTEFRARLGGTDEEPVEYAVYVTPVSDSDGSLRGAAVWFRDISARVRLQRKLKKQERLTSLGSMSGAVAHHYNNLIQGISARFDYARTMRTTAAMRLAIDQAQEPLDRAAELTQQLLIFAQADHRWCDQADLTETFLYFVDENEKKLAQRNIRLLADFQAIPITPIYRDHLMIILGNLTKNAIEAMPGGGVLTITLLRRDDRSVSISVSDTGTGISDQAMERIFEPFCSSKNELCAGGGRNAGLGLAVAHGLVAEMGGTITASNVSGRGARFDLVLPLLTGEAGA